jgi:hypothetical protein
LIQRTFVDDYTKYSLPLPDFQSIEESSNVYDGLKEENFVESGTSGAVLDTDASQIKALVDVWQQQSLISPVEQEAIKSILNDGNFFKTVREHTFKRDDGSIVYGLTGFVQLNKKDSTTATVFYSFMRYKFATPPTITYQQDTEDCIMWGISSSCKTKFDFSEDVTEDDAANMISYFKSQAVATFLQDSKNFITYLQKEEDKYSVFLPKEAKEAKLKLKENEGKRPDEVFDSDPLAGSLFDL